MLDLQFIREQPEKVRQASQAKNVAVDIDRLLALEAERLELKGRLDELNRQRNELARQHAEYPVKIPPADEGTLEELENKGRELRTATAKLEAVLKSVEQSALDLLKRVPNIPTSDTPVGPDDKSNRVLRVVGEKPTFSFTPKEHWILGAALGLIDNERAANVAGSRFTYLKGAAALLEFALVTHALALLTSRERLAAVATAARLAVPSTPFVPVIPPALVKPDTLDRMARLEPREDRYYLPTDDLYLVGSAEHTLGALHIDETLPEADLPVRYVGFSSSFRREAGSYGKDVHGILRLHQFDKLEMESFTAPEHSLAEQEFLVAIQEHLMQSLGLPYQVVLVCTGDMGGPDARQIDIEAWFPGQNRYFETHTADLVTDYQARRLHTKIRGPSGSSFAHMNDATVFAIGRTLAALLEVNQTADGSVRVPDALRSYLGGQELIAPPNGRPPRT